jgi:tRNA/tmRNA/rRNA uracil-C5-methylase (TrmA/RlmC/RlmD family)
VRKYIADHENSDIRKIILKHKEILGIPTAQLLDQISTRRKAKDKLPLYYHTEGVVYPPPENFEQSSSETTAVFKSSVIRGLPDSGTFTAADLSGGFGVDTYFLSKVVQKMHYVEPQSSLLDLAAHNHRLLGATNIEYHHTTAEKFIEEAGAFDLIYVDPSRRTASKRKIFSLEESQPAILSIAEMIFRRRVGSW